MGNVVFINKDMQTLFEKLQKLQNENVSSICVVATVEEGKDKSEEFFYCGSPAAILQSLALAQGYILQSYSLMEDCEWVEDEE